MPNGWLLRRKRVDRRDQISIRLAVADDMKKIFQWRNLKQIISLSQSQRPVLWNEHVNWFTQALRDNAQLIYIILFRKIEVGVCRLTKSGSHCDVTIYLAPDYQEQGIGSVALRKCLELNNIGCEVYRAMIRKDNLLSQNFFSKHGFQLIDSQNKILVYQKNNSKS